LDKNGFMRDEVKKKERLGATDNEKQRVFLGHILSKNYITPQ